MTASSQGFRRLALATVVATFLLVILGGLVRVSDSGLGCGPGGSGFHGWPLCQGDVVPGADLNTVVEYSHRTVASAVGLLTLSLFVLALRGYPQLRLATGLAFGGVVMEGLLGALTVEKNLEEELVAAHLGLAMLILALAMWIWRASRSKPDTVVEADPGFRRLAITTQVFVWLTVVAGGYMAGTQHYGRPDYQLGDGAHHACGREFPTCNGGFLPFGDARLVDIHLTHRVFMYITSALVIWLAVAALRRGLRPYGWALLGVLAVQILVGALNVWLEEYEALIVLHLGLGTLLWMTSAWTTMQLYRVPAPAVQSSSARELVTA
jgi:cytochrome c oxidase assembly protein subunit 15